MHVLALLASAALVTGTATASPEAERPVRFGALVGAGIPRPIALEVGVRLWSALDLGLEWATLPEVTLADIDFSMTSYQAVVRWFPWRGRLFAGLRAGVHRYGSESGSAVVHARVESTDAVFNPHVGWLWTHRSGLTLGADVGLQLVPGDAPRATLTDEAGGRLAEIGEDAEGIQEDAEDLAATVVKTPLPTVGLRAGFLF